MLGRVLRLLLVLRASCVVCVFPSKRQQKSLPVEGGATGQVGWGEGEGQQSERGESAPAKC